MLDAHLFLYLLDISLEERNSDVIFLLCVIRPDGFINSIINIFKESVLPLLTFLLCNVSILSFVRGIDRAAPQSRIRNEKKKKRNELISFQNLQSLELEEWSRAHPVLGGGGGPHR